MFNAQATKRKILIYRKTSNATQKKREKKNKIRERKMKFIRIIAARVLISELLIERRRNLFVRLHSII